MKKLLILGLILFPILQSCKDDSNGTPDPDDNTTLGEMYFPPTAGDTWSAVEPSTLN